MLRPLPILQEKDIRHATYDGVVVVPYDWEVGDLVNWRCDDVWWEATVTEINGEGKVKINLSKPPHGEGGVHIADALALRPSLLWSNKDQWSIPISKKKANGKPAARIVELSSPVWSKFSGPVKQLVRAKPLLPVEVELDRTRSSDDNLPDVKPVPCKEDPGRAAGLFANTTERNHVEGSLFDFSPQKISRQDDCTSSFLDDDSDDLSNALQLKRQQSKRHNWKFMIYRKYIKRAVDSDRRRRFKKHYFASCKIIDLSEESDGN